VPVSRRIALLDRGGEGALAEAIGFLDFAAEIFDPVGELLADVTIAIVLDLAIIKDEDRFVLFHAHIHSMGFSGSSSEPECAGLALHAFMAACTPRRSAICRAS